MLSLHPIAQGVLPKTQNSVTTTTTAFPSLDTSVKLAGGTGPKAGPFETCPLAVAVEKVAAQGPFDGEKMNLNPPFLLFVTPQTRAGLLMTRI